MSFFSEFEHAVIKRVFTWLSGLSEADFQSVLQFVIQAEQQFGQGNGEQKKKWVISQLEALFNNVLPYVLNFAVEFAVAYAKHNGYIPK